MTHRRKSFPSLRRLILAVILMLAIFCSANPDAFAQNQTSGTQNRGSQNSGTGDLVTKFTGKLKVVGRGFLTATRDDGSEVVVAAPQQATRLKFLAGAEPAFLKPGMLVRFQGKFNQAGQAQEKIDRVVVTQPVNGRVPGSQRQNFTPGIYVDGQRGNRQPAAVANVRVVGNLLGVDPSGTMTVQAGRQTLRVPVAADAKVVISVHHLGLAKVGDSVEVAGFYQPGDETKVQGDRVTVTTDRVLGNLDEESAPRGKSRRSRRKRNKKNQDGSNTKNEPADSSSAQPGS